MQQSSTITVTDQQERSPMIMLSTLRLTSVKIDKTCDPLDTMSSIKDSCTMDGIVSIAKPMNLQMIQEVKLTSQAWKIDGKWNRVFLPTNLVYTSGHKDTYKQERFLYQQTGQELACLPYSQHLGCNYCMSNSALPPMENPCIKEILSRKPIDSCTIEEVFDEKDKNHMQIIPHANVTKVVLTKDTPSNVISNCGAHENQVEVPESTKILIHPECTKIQVVDAPNVQELSSTVDVQSISSGHDHQQSDGLDPKFSMNPLNPKNWIEVYNVFHKAYLEINHVLFTVRNLTIQVDELFRRINHEHNETHLQEFFRTNGYIFFIAITAIRAIIFVRYVLSVFLLLIMKCQEYQYQNRNHFQGPIQRHFSSPELREGIRYQRTYDAEQTNQTSQSQNMRALPPPIAYSMTPAV